MAALKVITLGATPAELMASRSDLEGIQEVPGIQEDTEIISTATTALTSSGSGAAAMGPHVPKSAGERAFFI